MTRVIAHYDPARDHHDIYIVNDDGTYVTAGTERTMSAVVKVPAGEPGPVFISIPDRWAAEIAEALAPRPQATERHLDDAIAVRDRLLTLVERDTGDTTRNNTGDTT